MLSKTIETSWVSDPVRSDPVNTPVHMKLLKDSYEKHWNETMDYKNKPRLNGYENVRISHENNKRQLYN